MKTIYEFDKLGDCYSFNATTVSHLINEEKRIEHLLKAKNGLSITDREYLRRRHDELVYMYSDHSLISIVTNDQLLNAVCDSINGMQELDLRSADYYFPFGIYGDLHVTNDYLRSINYNSEKFRKDLFDKIGFEYNKVSDFVNENEKVDIDGLRRNGIKYSVNGINYGVDLSAYNMIDFYMKNLYLAPKVKVKTR